jgi:hypothetical protein
MDFTLCTSEAIERCKAEKPFSRDLTMEVASAMSKLDVKIGPTANNSQSISNCPYTLHELINDQGLSCVFGKAGQQTRNEPFEKVQDMNGTLQVELDKLGDTLQQIVQRTAE